MGMDWRRRARKVIVLIGDAGPHRPERAAMIARLAHNQAGIDFSCIAAHTADPCRLPSFTEIALYGGGAAVPLGSESGLLRYFVLYALGPAWTEEADRILAGRSRD